MTPIIVAGLLILSLALPAPAGTVRVFVRDRLTGTPVANATLLLVSDSPVVQTVLTDENGEAGIDVAAAKTVWVSIRSPKHGMRCFAVTDGAQELIVDLDESVRLSGSISDSSGKPLSGALVRLAPEFDPACRVHFTPQPTRADISGRYVLRDVDLSKRFAIAFESEGHERLVLDSRDVATRMHHADTTKAEMADDRRRELNVTLRIIK